jgi:dienelactone hydrolase
MIARRSMRAAALSLAAGFFAYAAEAQTLADRLSAPWPAIESTSRHDGQPVKLESFSPFTPFDALRRSGESPTAVEGVLAFPKGGAGNPRRIPAVVLLHGAAGVLWSREVTYARQLAELGVAALVVDTFGARRERATSFDERLIEITETMMVADAYAALRHLAARPEIDARRVALIGFSYGGMATLVAAYRQIAESFAPDGLRFAAHVSFYAPCIARFEDSRTTGAPVLMLWGSEDTLVDPKRCGEIAADLRGGGSSVETIVYPGAYHQWDGQSTTPRRMRRNLTGCSFMVEPDGTVRDTLSMLPMTGTFGRRLMLASCASSDGYTIGRDDAVRARSTSDLGRFLARVLADPARSGADSGSREGE